MQKKLEKLKNLTYEEITRLPVGIQSDYDLIQLADYYEEEDQNQERAAAVWDLALRSPFVDDMVDYPVLYQSLINHYDNQGHRDKALYWTVASIAYNEQHDPDNAEAILDSWLELARAYLESGDHEAGLRLYVRFLERFPGYFWTYNSLVEALNHAGLNRLALEVGEQGLLLLKQPDLDSEREEFEGQIDEIKASVSADARESEDISPALLAALRAAWSAVDDKDDAEKGFDLDHFPPVSRLIELESTANDGVEKEILGMGRVAIPELIHLGMDQDLAVTSGAPLRAARLLAQMRAGGVAELDALAFWLDRLPGEGERMWLGTQIDKIGGSTIAELEAAARDGDKSIEWRDYAVSELVKRVEQDASLREQVIDLIRDLLNREDQDQAEEETLNGFLIASALDLDAREILPDLEKAFDEDRVDPTIVDRYGIYEELELTAPEQPAPRTDGFNLRLECANCGRTRYHFTKYVIFDQTQLPERVEGREMMVMDHEIACPKCGAKDQYKVPAFERIQIMDLKPEQFMKMMTGQIPDEPPRYPPNVYFLQATAFGQPMHVLDAIDEYRRRISRDPKNADLHRRLGNIMRTIGRYPESLEHYRRAVELDGEDLELLISAASAEHDYGDLEAAERLYLRTIEVGKSNRDLLSGLSSEEVAAAQGLDFLRKGKRSIWEYQIINRQGKKLLPPARPGMETDMKKDKRPHRHGKKR